MSNFNFSVSELNQLASSIYYEYSDFIDYYEDRQVAKQEALNQYETRQELEIRLDKFRWFFETISLANQLETLSTYTKYGLSEEITHNCINVLECSERLSKEDICKKLKSIRYNSSKFLNQKIANKLDYFIDLVSDDLLRQKKELVT